MNKMFYMNYKVLGSNPIGYLAGLVTHLCYKAPCDFWAEIRIVILNINIR